MDENIDNQNFSQIYANDAPVHNFDLDYFGYKKVAKELAANVIQLDSESGYVIALNGKWGSGKSSFLFYTMQYLTDHLTDLNLSDNGQKPIVINFNPWLFSGHQDIVSQFFSQLKAQTNQYSPKISQKTLEVLNQLFTYGSYLNQVPTLEGKISGWFFSFINRIIERKLNKSLESIFELKPKIFKELQNSNEKIVIIIDDIDRLTQDEIKEVFRAIKAIADFPNIIFILAYDEEIVINALESEVDSSFRKSSDINSNSGLKYLEKIVQFSLPLPMIGEGQLKEYTEKIIFDKKFSDTNSKLIESTRWTDLYHNGLHHFLKTPRNVIRLHNALLMLYPSVKNEVNVVDFISLIVIRQNYPKLYNHIKDNHRFFIIDTWVEGIYFYRDQDPSILTKFHEEWINSNIKTKDRKEIAFILSTLFPEISPYIQHFFTKSSSYIIRSPKSLNISYNYDTFLKYFRFQSEADHFSESEIINILNSIKNPDEYADFISRLNSRSSVVGSKALTFFERILPLINEDISRTSLENFIIGTFKIKNEVFNVKNSFVSQTGFRKNILEYIEACLYKALTIYPKERKADVMRKSYSQGTSFLIEAELIIVIRQQNGEWEDGDWVSTRFNPKDPFLDLKELKIIEDIFLQKIQTAFSTDLTNFAVPYLGTIIFVWNKLNPNDPVLINVIDKMFADPAVMINIIQTTNGNNYINPIGLDSLEPIKSEAQFRGVIENILKTRELEETQKSMIMDFLKPRDRKRMDFLERVIKGN